ncbi:MAG TPA: MFS transporter [Candidatus Limnocylindria bacterium]|nr:MFS transporter [Candidatus Limnocylindria bacterium]
MRPPVLLGSTLGWFGISLVADGTVTLLVPHRLTSLAGDRGAATLIGTVTLIALVLAMLVQPVAGALSDRLGRRAVIVGGVLAVAGLAVVPAASIPAVAAGGTLALVGVSVAQAGQQALIPDRVDAAGRGLAAGLKGGFDVAGATVAFLLLAWLLGDGRDGPAAASLAVGLAVALLAGLALLRAGSPAAAPLQAPGRATRAGWSRPLARVVVARFLFLLGVYAVGRFLLLFVAERLDLGADEAAGQAGGALALLALVTAVASVPSGWLADRLGRRSMMVAGAALAAAGIGLLATAERMEAVLAFGTLMALGSAAFGAGSWALLTDLVAPSGAGRLLGLANFGTAGAAAAAGLAGPIIDAGERVAPGLGFTLALGAAAAASLAGGLLVLGMRAGAAPDAVGDRLSSEAA